LEGTVKFPKLTPAVFIKRDNRFIASVRLEGGVPAAAFVPTTGRLTGALRPGCRVWLEPAADPNRKTAYTLVLSELEGGGLCSVTAITANRLFHEAVKDGRLAAFPYQHIENEVPHGHSRLDFRLSQGKNVCWVEVKSVTCEDGGVGLFPDAPTSRGRRHLETLAKLAQGGDRASAVFIAQRGDAERFAPFETIDPAFAETLRQVHQAGVEVHAYRCDVGMDKIEIAAEIPVILNF
jgi:sugar fermentation stimulation protein A